MPDHDPLINDVLDGNGSVLDLIRTRGMTAGQLCEWFAVDRDQLADLLRLEDTMAQAMLNRCRRLAASRLAELTNPKADIPPETVRRACNDLLKTELPRAAAPSEDGKSLLFEELTRAMQEPADADT